MQRRKLNYFFLIQLDTVARETRVRVKELQSVVKEIHKEMAAIDKLGVGSLSETTDWML